MIPMPWRHARETDEAYARRCEEAAALNAKWAGLVKRPKPKPRPRPY